MAKALTPEQVTQLRAELVKGGVPVRFLTEGRCLNVVTGDLAARGTNVMYHTVYWNFTRETALQIAKWTGTKAVFSEE
jgi:hypothetical protein